MEMKEAKKIIKVRQKARKRMEKCRDRYWSGGDGTAEERHKRLREAEKEFLEASDKAREALATILCAGR